MKQPTDAKHRASDDLGEPGGEQRELNGGERHDCAKQVVVGASDEAPARLYRIVIRTKDFVPVSRLHVAAPSCGPKAREESVAQ
jgi:hypothetical protein